VIIEHKGFHFTLKPGGEVEVRSTKAAVSFYVECVVTQNDLAIWASGFMSGHNKAGWASTL
jgi:hypothetical protein